ncbi:hypothetical protein [Alcanivorax sp. S71-1-4]|uniref:hypothetical protein n=1 Tax=Alcanivorax sp. S71-1-4 TaxID=1177159 RepID=UPI00135CB4FE|nr:hypothetical protein [Alcanivorax sp. S71-1-4]
MQSYRSEHPNHVHQLSVCVSKHYWFTNDNILRYQQKKLEVPLAKCGESKKNHLVHYVLRDHCSGVIYAEVCSSRDLNNLDGFLFRAWSRKEEYTFCGIPEHLTIPKTIESVFPEIKGRVSLLGVIFPKVTSGFQSGIRDIKSLESFMSFYLDKPFCELQESMQKISRCFSSEKSRTGNESKIQLWENGINTVNIPSESWLEIA